ncbi:uncharacterized protein JCM15063_002534 [Sporobolomyces koalae]|uniref:uncharacterized protein n=1 Tax=Sporobolomyces koalae TaxID=500713 RepID=UPI0031731292
MSAFDDYTYSSPRLKYACPLETPDSAAWKTRDIAPEIDGTGTSSTQIQTKATTGPGCEVTFSGWKGSEGWIVGWTNPNASTWCCALDSDDFVCHSSPKSLKWDSVNLCIYSGLDPEKEHTIKIQNSPAGDSRLIINDAHSNGRTLSEIATKDLATIATVDKPNSIDLKDYYSTKTTASSASTSSTVTSTTTQSSSSDVDSTSTSTSTSTSEATQSLGSQIPENTSPLNSTPLSLTIALGVLAVLIVCIIAAMFLRTEPKQGREEEQLLPITKKRIRNKIMGIYHDHNEHHHDHNEYETREYEARDIEKGRFKRRRREEREEKVDTSFDDEDVVAKNTTTESESGMDESGDEKRPSEKKDHSRRTKRNRDDH